MKSGLTKKKSVLLVDDEKDLTQVLSMLLESRGYDVEIACSGTEALQKITSDYDLIILDIVLPDVNGFEICRRIKMEEDTRHIPIIMLSAHARYKDKVEGLYLGADDFLTKPCEHEELFARMEVVMRRRDSYDGYQSQYRNNIICELRKILDKALIVPYFQPIFLFNPFCIYGVEMLTRPTTQTDLANPEAFFKAALQYGLYVDLEMLAWSTALYDAQEYMRSGVIFLNCDPYLIESAHFLKINEIFKRNHIPIDNVVLEITERSAISDSKIFYKHLYNYREHGFKFAVDDVGGGYASLETIVKTKPEYVKIDRHIITNIHKDPFKRSIVKFVVSFCKENNIVSIAEGIEKQEELSVVKDLGVDAGQGYFLFKPTPEINKII